MGKAAKQQQRRSGRGEEGPHARGIALYSSTRLEIGSPPEDDGDCISIIKDENTTTEDRISKLPDDILQFVISLLTMREAAATCILSTRWRNLWTASASRLDFTDSNLLGRHYPRDLFQDTDTEEEEEDLLFPNKRPRLPRLRMMLTANRLLQRPPKHKRPKHLQNERTKFVKWVNRILKLRRASAMDTFTLSFPLGKESVPHLDAWMKLAAAQGVTKLDLDLNWFRFPGLSFDHSNRYHFPLHCFASSLTYLRLTCCTFDFPPHFRALNSLVSLNLHHSFLTDDNVQSILSNCPSLQCLSLTACVFPNPTILKLAGAPAPAPSTPILKHLDITRCRYIEEIQLHNLNHIVSFQLYAAKSEKLSIRDVPRLSRLVLQTRGAVVISGAVPRLHTLFLNHRLDGKLPHSTAAFNSLKRLVFSVGPSVSNLFEVVSLLDACPSLQQLELDMRDFCRPHTEPSAHLTTVPGFLHSTLTQVEMRAFQSHPEQIELAKYLLKTAIVLKKMKIYTTCKTYIAQNGTALKEEVYKLLRKEARPSTKLLIRSTST